MKRLHPFVIKITYSLNVTREKAESRTSSEYYISNLSQIVSVGTELLVHMQANCINFNVSGVFRQTLITLSRVFNITVVWGVDTGIIRFY